MTNFLSGKRQNHKVKSGQRNGLSDLGSKDVCKTRDVEVHPCKLTFSPLKMLVFNRNLLFQGSIFRGYVRFREGTLQATNPYPTMGSSENHRLKFVPAFGGICDRSQDPQEGNCGRSRLK